ncbi:FliM/FliN family flagellar motor C-terminal domain-containing protein [Ralstonia pickettii]|uniref:FliM/FliN family flagellar motor C-terminal domain-containing protein n=1 Tax=Ralstonia pickettii TaxID=329 RepID=UPI0015BDCBFA|nr:FliM/FliN family flagellar motor C-terminal domain-containing protein [Ralstonia pickettii]NWK44755.1 FliM/FliN family flagellar motor switch protein [Ralstonia pickettii]
MNVAGKFSEEDRRTVPAEHQALAMRWWPDAQLRRLAAELQTLCDEWMNAWALPHAVPMAGPLGIAASERFSHADAGGSAAGLWMALSAGNDVGQAWWTVESGVLRPGGAISETSRIDAPDNRAVVLVRAALFGASDGAFPIVADGPQSRIADDVATEAVEDWRARLNKWTGCAALDRVDERVLGAGSLPVPLAQPWSGAVWLSIDWIGHRFALVMDFSHAARMLGHRNAVSTDAGNTDANAGAGLVSVLAALSGENLSVSVELSPLELDLGTLSGLRVGDVVRVPHTLETPLLVRLNEGAPLFQGFLGRLDEHKALELQRADSMQ